MYPMQYLVSYHTDDVSLHCKSQYLVSYTTRIMPRYIVNYSTWLHTTQIMYRYVVNASTLSHITRIMYRYIVNHSTWSHTTRMAYRYNGNKKKKSHTTQIIYIVTENNCTLSHTTQIMYCYNGNNSTLSHTTRIINVTMAISVLPLNLGLMPQWLEIRSCVAQLIGARQPVDGSTGCWATIIFSCCTRMYRWLLPLYYREKLSMLYKLASIEDWMAVWTWEEINCLFGL